MKREKREVRDIPIIGQNSPTNQAVGLLSASLMWQETAKVLQNKSAFEGILKVAALRESAGVKDKGMTINIRRPPRYAGTF